MVDEPMMKAPPPKSRTRPHPSLSPEAQRKMQAIRDLTADFNPYSGVKAWWYKDNYTSALTNKLDQNGVHIVTYTLEASVPFNEMSNMARDIAPLKAEQRQALYDILKYIEKTSNIKFIQVEHVDRKENADIRFFQGRIRGEKGVGPDAFTANCSVIRDVVIRNELDAESFGTPSGSGYKALLHETLHALGLSHPDRGRRDYIATGKSEYYQDETVMASKKRKESMGLGPYDVATLQYLYGKSRKDADLGTSSDAPAPNGIPIKSRDARGIN